MSAKCYYYFNDSSKLYFDLHYKIEGFNGVSGNLLQIFESKGITSNMETNVKFFMSKTLFFFFFLFFFSRNDNKRNVMREETTYFSQQTYISLDC